MSNIFFNIKKNLGLYATYFFFFSMPLYRKIYFYNEFHISPPIIALSLYALWGIINYHEFPRFKIDRIAFMWIVFLGMVLVSVVRAKVISYHFGIWLSLFSSGLFFYFITYSLKDLKQVYQVLKFTALGATIASLCAIIFLFLYLTGISTFGVMKHQFSLFKGIAVTGFGTSRLGFGYNLIPGAIIIFWYLLWSKWRPFEKVIWFSSLVIVSIGLFLSMSRGAWISFITVAYISIFLFLYHKKPRAFIYFLVINIALILIIIPFLIKFTQFFININEKSVDIRLYLWKNAIPFLPKALLIGQGFGTFRYHIGVNVHNILLDVFMGGGLVSLIAMIGLFGWESFHLFRLGQRLPKYSFVALSTLCTFIAIFVASQFLGRLTWRYLWGFLGLSNAIVFMGKNEIT